MPYFHSGLLFELQSHRMHPRSDNFLKTGKNNVMYLHAKCQLPGVEVLYGGGWSSVVLVTMPRKLLTRVTKNHTFRSSTIKFKYRKPLSLPESMKKKNLFRCPME